MQVHKVMMSLLWECLDPIQTGTDDFDTDLQEDEDDEYKSLEIKKGPNVYSCSFISMNLYK